MECGESRSREMREEYQRRGEEGSRGEGAEVLRRGEEGRAFEREEEEEEKRGDERRYDENHAGGREETTPGLCHGVRDQLAASKHEVNSPYLR